MINDRGTDRHNPAAVVGAALNRPYSRAIQAVPLVLLLAFVGIKGVFGAEAPGAPGIHSTWTTGAKQGLGTSASH